jgi:hypothetical protein
MTRLTTALLGLPLLALAPATAAAQPRADGHYFATWKLNVEKSNYYGRPAPKEQWMIVTDRGCDAYYSIVKGVSHDGKALMTQYIGRFDKKPSPMLQLESPLAATVSNWVTGPDSSEFTTFRGGKVAGHGRRKMSRDGKVLVVEQYDPNGKPTSLLWWELDKT